MDDELTQRLTACEHRCRVLRNISVAQFVLILAVLAGFLFGCRPLFRGDILRVHGIAVIDDRGIERIRLDAKLPDPIINGKRFSRGQTAAGILLYDSTGNERSGYATFNQSGYVALTLDTRHSQVASFAADPERGVAMKVWDGKDMVALTAFEDMANIRIFKADSVHYQLPPKAKIP